jgi:polyferredoxin
MDPMKTETAPRPPLYPLRVAVVALLWLAVVPGLVWIWGWWVGWSDWCWRVLVAGVATCAGGWVLDLGWKLLRLPEKGEREGRRREG